MNKKLLVILLSNYGAVISLGFFTPIFALYVIELGGTVYEAGIATAIYYFVGGLLMLLFRWVINNRKLRIGYYVWGNFLEGVTALLYLAVNTVPQFYLAQLVHALATAMRIPSQRTLYAQFEDRGKEGSEWSIMEGGNFIIIGISAAAGGYVASTFSFQSVFMIMAIIQFLTTLYCLRLYKHNGKKLRKRT
jgi:sugar phosphate permease